MEHFLACRKYFPESVEHFPGNVEHYFTPEVLSGKRGVLSGAPKALLGVTKLLFEKCIVDREVQIVLSARPEVLSGEAGSTILCRKYFPESVEHFPARQKHYLEQPNYYLKSVE